MILTVNRTDYPSPDVAMGTLNQWFTLQHDPTPLGLYTLVPHVIQTGPLAGLDCYCLVNPNLGVFEEPNPDYSGPYPMRFAVLIHKGNWAKDTIGCIIVGTSRDGLPNPPNVVQSGGPNGGFTQLMELLGTGVTGHQLLIQGVES